MSADEGFFSRWARRKRGVDEGAPPEPSAAAVRPEPALRQGSPEQGRRTQDDRSRTVGPGPVEGRAANAVATVPAAEPPPTLADVEALAPGDEVSRFVARGVDAAVQRAAVKKLFTDPHFNIMDGLDTYIDDYGIPDPIPAAMLREMHQSKALGLFADEDEAVREAPPQAPAPVAEPPQGAESPPPPPPPQQQHPAPRADDAAPPARHEDPDLQLQPDDPARRPGPDEGAGPGRV